MVKRGVAFIKAEGAEKGYAEITNKKGSFVDRDLYLVVYGLDGMVLAHGAGRISRRSVGTTVFGGMIASTFLNLIFIPILYVLVRRLQSGWKEETPAPQTSS